MLVTYSLIIVPSILFINNVAYHWGPGVIVVTVCLVVCTLGYVQSIAAINAPFTNEQVFRSMILRFYTMTACSDPGIVFIKVPSPDSDPSSRQAMARDASAEESEALQLVKRDSYDKREERRESEDGLIDGDVEMGTLPQEHSDDREGERRTSPAAGTSRSLPSPKASTNRIVVGQVASANRPAHNSNTHSTALALLGTPAAPYLPPPPLVECGRCQLDRPRDASHCHYCGVCVKQLDHHCPVSVACVAIGNVVLRYGTRVWNHSGRASASARRPSAISMRSSGRS